MQRPSLALSFFSPSPEGEGRRFAPGTVIVRVADPPRPPFGVRSSPSRGGDDLRGTVSELRDREPVGELERLFERIASRVAMSGRTTRRSTTTSISWVNFLSSAGTSAIS